MLTGLEGLIRRTINADVEIRIKAAADVLPIKADPDQLETAILNLVINARDAMPDGGRLMIEASNVTLTLDDLLHYEGMSAGRCVMITVSDTGCGMPQGIAERVLHKTISSDAARPERLHEVLIRATSEAFGVGCAIAASTWAKAS